MRRVIGATTKTAGKARAQLGSQPLIQRPRNWASSGAARAVAMPETMKDMSPERMKPKRMWA